MAILKTEAVVLRVQDYRESSKILTLYTLKYGRLKLLAKGARRLKSRFGGVLDLMSYLAIVFYHKETRDLQLLSQADLVQPFPHLREDIRRLAVASAVAELIDRTEFGQLSNPMLFKLLVECLTGIDEFPNPKVYFDYFTLHFLNFAGFRPRLRRCLHCGQKPNGQFVDFHFHLGGYFCQDCSRDNQDSGFQASLGAIRTLLALRDASVTSIRRLSISPATQKQIEALLLYYLQYHLEGFRGSTSLGFLKRFDNGKFTQRTKLTSICKEEISV